MPKWLRYLIAALAVYRLSRMLAEEEGPASVFEAIRALPDPNYDSSFPEKSNWIARGLHCPLCLSFWGGLLVALFLAICPEDEIFNTVLDGLALSGAAVVLHNKVG